MNPSSRTRAIQGFLQGFFFFGALGCFRVLWQDRALADEWILIVGFGLAAGTLFAIGRAIVGQITGSVLGGVAFGYLGWVLGTTLLAGLGTIEFQSSPHVPIKNDKEFRLAGPTLDGKQLNISDLKGKVVLVDFWATWCPPCIAELPTLKKMYERYHQEGFEIVGVSLDEDLQEFREQIKKLELPWPQIFFADENKMRKNPLALEHNVRGIPATFLLNKDGQLVAQGLRGNTVVSAVEGLLGKAIQIPGAALVLVPVMFIVGGVVGAVFELRLRQGVPTQSGARRA